MNYVYVENPTDPKTIGKWPQLTGNCLADSLEEFLDSIEIQYHSRWTDFLSCAVHSSSFPSYGIFLSEKAKETLQPYCDAYCEFYECMVNASRKGQGPVRSYYLLVKENQELIDYSKTKIIDYSTDEVLSIHNYEEYREVETKRRTVEVLDDCYYFKKQSHLFTIPGEHASVYFSEELIQVLKDNQLTGIRLGGASLNYNKKEENWKMDYQD